MFRPPPIPHRLFRWFCNPKLRDSIEGDLLEIYAHRVRTSGKRKADIQFTLDVFLLLRKEIIRPAEGYQHVNTYGMFKNYFLIGWRSLLKQKMYAFIKIGGFAAGIAACILIALYVNDELSYDQHYPDADRIYRVIGIYNDHGQLNKGVHFQPPMAKALVEDYPQIEAAGRYNNVDLFGAAHAEVRRSDQSDNFYQENMAYIDPSLVAMFGPTFIYGNPSTALATPRSVILTRTTSIRYFAEQDPVGKTLILNNDASNPYTVTGVVEDPPAHSHLRFEFLVSLSNWEFWKGEQTDWCCSNYPTYVKIKAGVNADSLSRVVSKGIIDKYIVPILVKEGRSDVKEIIENAWIELQPVSRIHLYSDGIQDGLQHGDIRFVWLFAAVALFILILAIINFVNLATARSANRAREVGMRKVVGSLRTNLVNQFLTESILYSVLSFVIGLLLAIMLLPYFNAIATKALTIPFSSWWFIPLLLLSAAIVGILAGLYPAFYLSSFRPIQVLKGNLSVGSRSAGIRSVLVVFQFTVSIVLIAATLVIYRQMDFLLNYKLGYSKEQVVYFEGAQTLGNQLTAFKEELRKVSGVQHVSISDYLPVRGTKRNGNMFAVEGKQTTDRQVQGQFWKIDDGYIKTLGLTLADGRNFDPAIRSDSAAVIINQKMAHELGLADPVGARIFNGRIWTVVGVVDDFHFESLREKVTPLAMAMSNEATIVSVKVNTSDMKSTLDQMSAVWKSLAPNQPVRYAFLDQSYARMYEDVNRMGSLFTGFAVLAILVACLGLFALSAFTVEQRTREISIRMVLGASGPSVFRLLSSHFMMLTLIAILVATPLAWYGMSQWLEQFAFRIELEPSMFLLAAIFAITISLATIALQGLRAATMNPIKGLRAD